jgi:hypothetical protein
MKAEDWAYRFAVEVLRLGVRADPDSQRDLGLELFETQGNLLPEPGALAESKEWPPGDPQR